MTQTISQLSFDKNGIYKQTTLKCLDVVNYYLKGVTRKSAGGGHSLPNRCIDLVIFFFTFISQYNPRPCYK